MKLYRCLYDGKFTANVERKPSVCENCHRDVIPTTHRRPRTRTALHKQIELKIAGTYRFLTHEIVFNQHKSR